MIKMRLVSILAALICSVGYDRLEAQPQILQAFVGFNQPNNMGIPCVACLGFPESTVVIQPNNFVSSGSTGVYYAVLQTRYYWTGSVSTTFQLTGAGSVIGTATATASIQGAYVTVVSVDATIPQTSYSGPATLTATTTATPTSASPSMLVSFAAMQVGTTGARKLVNNFVGVSSSNGYFGLPCAYPICGPPGAVVVQADEFLEFEDIDYAVFQANGWVGDLLIAFDVLQDGKIVGTRTLSAAMGGGTQSYSVQVFGIGLGGNLSSGPAMLAVITQATPRFGTEQPFTLRATSPLEK